MVRKSKAGVRDSRVAYERAGALITSTYKTFRSGVPARVVSASTWKLGNVGTRVSYRNMFEHFGRTPSGHGCLVSHL